jgi:hypothetical protein
MVQERRSKDLIRRYTELPWLLHSLAARELTFLSPALWDDRNDAYFIDAYRRSNNLGAVLAVCFTQAAETYHHWKVFAPGPSGVCVVLHKNMLLDQLGGQPGLRCESVEYRSKNDLKRNPVSIKELPFVKQRQFADDRECRMILELDSSFRSTSVWNLPFDPSTIAWITLSPWLPQSARRSVWDSILNIDGCEHLTRKKSTVVVDDEWQSLCEPK